VAGDRDRLGLTDTAAAAAPSATAATVTATGGAGRLPAGGSLTGRRLAHFVLEEELGRGGMGVVYRARDLSLDRPVAIKVLAEEVAESEERRQRFYREARAQGRINHPNVGHIYFIGEEGPLIFFAMELIEGQPVAALLAERERLGVREALDICRQAARGLTEAAAHGVVHRDVKPSNLMIDKRGVVKVLDFGIAAEVALAPVAGGEASGALAEQTTLGGTPLYAAPEQVRGEAIDFRADIYALGVTLHQLVTGAPPFVAETVAGLVDLHTSSDRPRYLRRQVGKRDIELLDGLTDRMMAKRPDDRFASYEELIAELDFVEPSAARPAGAAVRGLTLFLDLILVLIVFGLAMLGFAALGMEPDETLANRLLWLVWLPYQIVTIGRWGATLGQRLVGLEVVVRDRRRGTGAWRATIRTLVWWGPVVTLLAISDMFEVAGYRFWEQGFSIAAVALGVIEVLHLAWVSWRSASGRTLWDRAAGTQVRYLRLPTR
jgi:uncharacterized RDD family membrane protein YckC/predicted Ser/Thr protein kinase